LLDGDTFWAVCRMRHYSGKNV